MRLYHVGLLLITPALLGLYYILKGNAIKRENGRLKLLNREEHQNIVFLKTHKCGSSTVQNILLRFGYVRGLSFVLPNESNYLGHPAPFTEKMIPPYVIPEYHKFNIFTHHTRYNYTSMKSVMQDDAVFVTILRNPISLFESLFSYYNLQNFYGASLQKVLELFPPNHIKFKARYLKKLGVNQMSFDLGLDEKYFNNTKKLFDFVNKLEKEFDLVMISEYMEVSLVLLTELMNWPLSYTQFLSLNMRKADKIIPLSLEDQKAALQINQGDLFLYEFFLKKFQDRIFAYGVERMEQNVKKLISLNHKLYMRCVERTNSAGYNNATSYVLKNKIDWLCNYAAMNELQFTQEITNYQITQTETLKKLHSLTNMMIGGYRQNMDWSEPDY